MNKLIKFDHKESPRHDLLEKLNDTPNNYTKFNNSPNQDDNYKMHSAISIAIACDLLCLKTWRPVKIGRYFCIIIRNDEVSKFKDNSLYKVALENNGGKWLEFLNDKSSIEIACNTIEEIYKLYNKPNAISPDLKWKVYKGLRNDLVDKYNSL